MIKGRHLGLIVFFMTFGVIANPISDQCFDSNNPVEHKKSIESITFCAGGYLLLYKVVNKQPVVKRGKVEDKSQQEDKK